MSVEVIGAGFGRTGTFSLKSALDMLGFKTHHMVEVVAGVTPSAMWRSAKRAKDAGRPTDWQAVFDANGYTAAVDWPTAHFYKELMQAYPKAKIILTTRDFDAWHASASETIHAVGKLGAAFHPPPYLAPLYRRPMNHVRMIQEVIWRGTFGGRFEDKEHARKVYEAHVEEVKRVVPPERLLVYDIKQGWAPLCAFLGRPVPQEPFPKANDTEEFLQGTAARRRYLKRMRRVFAACNSAVAALAAGAAVSLLRCAARRVKGQRAAR